MKKLIVSLLVLAAMLSAAIVDSNRAQKVAENYYKNYAPESAKGNTVQDVLTKEYMGQPTWYVVQFTEGFVIVAADDAVRPILGYAFEGYVDKDLYNMQNPFIHRFSFFDRQIVHDIREQGLMEANAAEKWKNIENNVFPSTSKAIVVPALLETNWGQGWPWNDQCPTGCPVGCVATAMHQIMRYHMGPNQGYSSAAYTDNSGTTTGSHSVDFSSFTYDWGSIAHIIDSGDVVLQSEVDELAMVSYHAGVSVSMDYETDGSGAYSFDADNALIDHFGFDTALYQSFGTISDPTTFASTIQSNLDDGNPVYWSGTDVSYGGHAFVLDGYTDDYLYHFNWGWDGSANGWYALNDMDTGSGAFVSSQAAVYNISINSLIDEWPAPGNVASSIANGEDVTVTWDRPTGVKLGTLTGYNVYRNDVLIGTAPEAATSYNDNDLSEGIYDYIVRATYSTPDGESPKSTLTTETVTADANFPVATAVSTTVNGRTSIDVAWAKPYTGAVYWDCDFEVATDDPEGSEWYQAVCVAYPPNGAKVGNPYTKGNDTFDRIDPVAAGLYTWFWCDENSFGDPQYIHSGTYSMATGYTTGSEGEGLYTWAMSPEFTLDNPDAHLYYWHWLQGNATYQTYYYVNLYNGTQNQADPSQNLTEIAAYEDVGVSTPANVYQTEIDIDLSAYTGTYRLGFCYYYTDGYQMAIDDIIIGTAAKGAAVNPNAITGNYKRLTGVRADGTLAGQPVSHGTKAGTVAGYEVYRNGSLATTIGNPDILTWNDTSFEDGINEYFVRSTFTLPTGTSIPSERDAAMMYANPAPWILDGVAVDPDVDLTWYAPFHMPPHWMGFTDDTFETYFDFIEGMETSTWNERRTLFTAAGLGLGYAYPFTIDSLAAAFYDGTGTDWTGSAESFTYELWTSNYAGTADSVIFTSAPQTAVSGYWNNLVLDQQHTMNWGWYVSLNVSDLGYPSSFVNYVDQSHSSVYIGAPYDGWYNITYGDGQSGDWAILTYGQGSVDTWYYNKGETPVEHLTLSPSEVMKGSVKPELNITTQNSKNLVQYHIWRNSVDIATTTNTYYTDTTVPADGNYEYYITAEYASPAGTSDPCASVFVDVVVGGGPVIPAVPANVVTTIAGANLVVDWDVSADATGYDVYASDDPYGTFSLVGSVGTNQYTVAADQAKMFYYIVATNATKIAPKTIKVPKSVK